MYQAQGCLRGIATRPAKRAAMRAHEDCAVLPDAGLEDDFGRRRGRAQVTILAEEAWRAACEDVGAALAWTTRRANLLVAGIPLRPLAGSRIVIGAVTLEVTGEAQPCYHMDEVRAGLSGALKPEARGGVRCRVLSGGRVALGDDVVWQPAMSDLFTAPAAHQPPAGEPDVSRKPT